MSGCLGCKYAKWKVTANGRLHPSGKGECTYEVIPLVLPISKYFHRYMSIGGGTINRKPRIPMECPCYQNEET